MPRRARQSPALAAVIGLLGLAVAGCGSGAKAPPQHQGHDMLSIFEAGPQLRISPVATVATLRGLGVDVVKVFLPWQEVAPAPGAPRAPAGFDATNPAAYPAANWATWDAIVRAASARGLGVDLTISKPPLWAHGPDPPHPGLHPQWRTSPAAFGAFMRALGTRYSGRYKPPGVSAPLPRVTYWSIWNEPNFGPDLAPQAIDHNTVEASPAVYRGLADAGWSALQATGHGRDTILIGEMAPRGTMLSNSPGNFGGMVPLRFIRALYCVDASFRPLRGSAAAVRDCPATAAGSRQFPARHPVLFKATGFADHPYGQGSIPPDMLTPDEPDFADFAALPRLESTLDRIVGVYGSSRRFPIYNTEFGYQTNPPERITIATTPQTAAKLANWAEYLSWRNPRVVSFDQYQLRDPDQANAAGGFATGLRFKNGRRKPTYAAYVMPVFLPVRAFGHGQKLEVWGGVRPARVARLDTGKAQSVEIQFRAVGSRQFQVLRALTLATRYFDTAVSFPGSGTVRLAWRNPSGQIAYSRRVTIAVR